MSGATPTTDRAPHAGAEAVPEASPGAAPNPAPAGAARTRGSWVLYLDRADGTDPGSARPEPRALTGPTPQAPDAALRDIDRADPQAVADAVAASMAAEAENDHAVLYLALGTQLCFSAEVATDDLPRRDRLAVLKYRFEDRLPLPLEEVEIAFVDPADAGDHTTLGVAVATAWLAALCNALSEAGVRVASVSPTSLLGAQALMECGRRPAGPAADLLLVQSGPPGSLVATEAVVLPPPPPPGTDAPLYPTGWFGFAAAPQGGGPSTRAQLVIQRLAAARGRPLRVWTAPGIDRDLIAGLSDHPQVAGVEGLRWPASGGSPPQRPWIDLRRGVLDPARAGRDVEQWRRWSVAAMLVLALLTAGFWIRGSRYAGSFWDARDQTARVYRQASGSRGPVPASPTRALRAVLAERTAAQGDQRGVSGVWAHERLFNTLRALPQDGSVRVTRLSAGPDAVELVAQTADHLAADRVAAALTASDATGLNFSVNRATSSDDDTATVTVDLVGRAPGTGGGYE